MWPAAVACCQCLVAVASCCLCLVVVACLVAGAATSVCALSVFPCYRLLGLRVWLETWEKLVVNLYRALWSDVCGLRHEGNFEQNVVWLHYGGTCFVLRRPSMVGKLFRSRRCTLPSRTWDLKHAEWSHCMLCTQWRDRHWWFCKRCKAVNLSRAMHKNN